MAFSSACSGAVGNQSESKSAIPALDLCSRGVGKGKHCGFQVESTGGLVFCAFHLAASPRPSSYMCSFQVSLNGILARKNADNMTSGRLSLD